MTSDVLFRVKEVARRFRSGAYVYPDGVADLLDLLVLRIERLEKRAALAERMAEAIIGRAKAEHRFDLDCEFTGCPSWETHLTQNEKDVLADWDALQTGREKTNDRT